MLETVKATDDELRPSGAVFQKGKEKAPPEGRRKLLVDGFHALVLVAASMPSGDEGFKPSSASPALEGALPQPKRPGWSRR